MNSSLQREQALFEAALALESPADRVAFLATACAEDVVLRQKLQELLQAHAEGETFFSESAQKHIGLFEPKAAPAPPAPPAEAPAQRIGPYKLLEQIGEGGCGAVFAAEQLEPVRRRVALKIIKLGMDTPAVVARFEAERQALALMDHPNIARVLDAGATDSGRPYFVMELVRGVKITEFCDQHELSTAERLEIFVQVCQAVQHAHQKGIIHRDLKPSNILVSINDGKAVPKVIDFGIAKAINQAPLTEKTIFTSFHQLIGTPEYMSPEQMDMSSVELDTRTDIYSLGVLLYELLTGKTPFDTRELLKVGLDAMRRTIREQEPTRPSTRLTSMVQEELTTTARRRKTEAPRLISTLRGDLDWIVMKALEKERASRYETSSELARDLEHYLHNEPVLARPPSRIYRLGKWIRRNRIAFAAGALVAGALVFGLGLSTVLYLREREARRQEELMRRRATAAEAVSKEDARTSREVAQFLKDTLGGAAPSIARGRDTKLLQEIVQRTGERIGRELKDQPHVEAELRDILGGVYEELGDYKAAEAMFRLALAKELEGAGKETRDSAISRDKLAIALARQGRLKEAEALCRAALATRRSLLGDGHLEVALSLNNLGNLLWEQGRLAEAEQPYREGLAIIRKTVGNAHMRTAEALGNLGNLLAQQDKLVDAEAMFRESLAIFERVLPSDHPTLAQAMSNLATALANQGKLDEAEALYRRAIALRRKVLGEEHPDLGTSLNNLGTVLRDEGKLNEADVSLREALAIRRKALGNDDLRTALTLFDLASVLQREQHFSEAEAAYREVVAIRRKRLGNDDVDVARALNGLGAALIPQAKFGEAQTTLQEAIETFSKIPNSDPSELVEARKNLATALQGQGRNIETEKQKE